jgi:hypothetical protein
MERSARRLTGAVHEDLAAAIDRQRALFRIICLNIPSRLPVEVGQQRQCGSLSHGIAQGLREKERTLPQFYAIVQPFFFTI